MKKDNVVIGLGVVAILAFAFFLNKIHNNTETNND